MIKSRFWILVALFTFGFTNAASSANYTGEIYDAHAHIPKGVKLEQIKSIYTEAGVSGAGLFVKDFKDSNLKKVQKQLGQDFILFADVHKRFKTKYEVQNKRIKRMEGLYNAGLIAGLGEIYTDLSFAPFAPKGIKTDITDPDEVAYLEIANKLGMPVHIHHESPDADFEATLRKFKNINFILAHSGYLSPQNLDALMSEHPNLFADLSLISNRHFGPFKKRGVLLSTNPSKEWVEVLVQHSNRFMVGSDIGANVDRVKMLPAVIADYRVLLGSLPQDAAKRIASENFLRIFK